MNDKVTMIGLSGAGKTCFLYAMYNFMSIPQGGFVFTAKDPDVDLDLADGWDQIIIDKTWPRHTDESGNYDFYVQYAGAKIADFSWYDYRGGALMERSDSSEDVRYLNNKISSSNALIIFLDADQLVLPLNYNKRQFQRLLWCVNSTIAQHKDPYFPISFVITKGDKYDYDTLLNSPGFNYFNNNVFESIRNSQNVAGLFTITEVTSTTAYNVYFPLMFSIYHGLENYEKQIIKQYQRKKSNLDIFERIGEFFSEDILNSTISEINSLKSNNNRIEELLKEYDGQCIMRF